MAFCGLLALASPRHLGALWVLAVLVCFGWMAHKSTRFAVWAGWRSSAAVVAACSVAYTGGSESPLLPYLVAPALAFALTAGLTQVVLVAGAMAAGLLLSGAVHGLLDEQGYAVAGATWVVLGLALGILSHRTRALVERSAETDSSYAEVHQLLEQLQSATRRLPGGLDSTSAAEALLDRCQQIVPFGRAAVIAQPTEGATVPLAVRGARRVPWRAPLDGDGPLAEAWTTGRPVLQVRSGDSPGRRRGSALAVLPMLRAGVPFGLVILESPDLDVFDEQVLADLERLVRSAAPQLETALLFEEVRSAASGEERDRLARQMHDGVAQELASVGYRLDSLRSRAASVDPALADEVAQVRAEMTRVISDIRLSITDLTTTLGPERGLGAALSGYLRAVCSGKDVVLHLSLQESAFRLPPDQEVLLANLTHAFAQQVRESRLVRNLWVDLEVDPPSGRLRLEHDGPGDLSADLSRYCLPLVNAGAHVSASHGLNGSPRLDVSLEGSADDHQRPARR